MDQLLADVALTSSPSLEIGLPQLIPAAAKKDGEKAPVGVIDISREARDAAGPCESVTRATITALRDAIELARVAAADNVAKNGESVPEAEYKGAATYSLANVTNAKDWMDRLLTWLETNGLFEPPDDRVTNTSAAYNVYGYCRETVVQLHHGLHWAAVSAAWNSTRGTAQPARDCIERISEALALLDPLAAQATRCYLAAYFG